MAVCKTMWLRIVSFFNQNNDASVPIIKNDVPIIKTILENLFNLWSFFS